MCTKQATTIIGHYNFCPYCGVKDPFTLSHTWPHGECHACGRIMTDTRASVAVAVFWHRGKVCAGKRAPRNGLPGGDNWPGGYVEEHNDQQSVHASVTIPHRRLTIENTSDGESIEDAAFAELQEETGYCGPRLKARLYTSRIASSRHERLFFVEFIVADPSLADADPSGWFSVSAVKTPGELTEIFWMNKNEMQDKKRFAFPIFAEVAASWSTELYPLLPKNVRSYKGE